MKMTNFRILVVAAHPDDEVLGCGGTIAKFAALGAEVSILILGEGLTSRYSGQEPVKRKELSSLKVQAKNSTDLLGAKDVFFAGFPDNKFDSVPLLGIIKEIESVKAKIKPSAIYTHHYGDLNIDHVLTYKAVLTATRPLEGETVKEIYSFAIPSSTDWSGPDKKSYFIPDRYVDISTTINKKIRALKCYKTEIRNYPHSRSAKGVEYFAAKYGMEAGLKYSEPFQTIRAIIK